MSAEFVNTYIGHTRRKHERKLRRHNSAIKKMDVSVGVVKAYMKFRKPIDRPVLTHSSNKDKVKDLLKRIKIKQHEMMPVRKTLHLYDLFK